MLDIIILYSIIISYCTMINENENINRKLISSIEAGDEIVIISYSILDNIDNVIRFILRKSLNTDSAHIISPIFASVKEIITNAIKANVKNILIKEEHLDEKKDNKQIIFELKKVLTETEIVKFEEHCQKAKISVSIHFNYDNDDYFKISIINPVPLNDSQLERINNKIEIAKQYDSLAHFYMENPDPLAEGMGLGISMVIVLLKGINIPVNNFSFNTDKKTMTKAILKIPYNHIH